MEAVIFSQEQLEKLCREWQGILRLNDWDIVIAIERQGKFSLDGVHAGECDPTLTLKEGYIRILNPIDWPSDSTFPQDMEKTLVHELLHHHFIAFRPEIGTLQHDLYEQSIELLAKSLIGLKRNGHL